MCHYDNSTTATHVTSLFDLLYNQLRWGDSKDRSLHTNTRTNTVMLAAELIPRLSLLFRSTLQPLAHSWAHGLVSKPIRQLICVAMQCVAALIYVWLPAAQWGANNIAYCSGIH